MFVKKFRKVVKIISVSFAVLSAITACIACDIGLGGAVDTEAPTGSISSPDVDAVIRGVFGLKGTWQDDGTVGAVNITLKNTSTNSVSSYNATVDSKGSWSCEINPLDTNQLLKDGSYLATVTLTDNGGHNTVLTRSYTIDNTPPLMVITRPSTKAGVLSFDSYGQTFSLQGQAVDDNNVSKVVVNVYGDESCTNLKKTVTLKNVPATMELDVAKFVNGDTENDYYQIYGSPIADGTKKFYCTFTAFDDAKYYPLNGENSDDGNSTSVYYLYNDISSVINDYKVTEIHHMYTGSYSGDSDAVAAVKQTLSQNSGSEGQFSLNPNNNPTYTVSGRSYFTSGTTINETDTNYNFTNESGKLVVEVSPGLDKISINPDTVGIYLLECENDGSPISTADDAKVWLFEVGSTSTKGGTENQRVTVGTSYKYTSDVISVTNFNLKIGSIYRLYVVGTDVNGNPISVETDDDGKSKIFAFYLISTGSKIELSLVKAPDFVSTNADANDENKVAKMTLTYAFSDSNSLDVYRADTNPSGDIPESGKIGTTTSGETTYIDTLNITTSNCPEKLYYQLKTSDELNTSYKKSIVLNYDNTPPTLETPDYPSSSDTSQTSFIFSGLVSDASSGSDYAKGSGIKSVSICITDNSDSTKTTGNLDASLSTGSDGSITWSYKFNSSSLSSYGAFDREGYKTVTITATDNVGLKTTIAKENWLYALSPEFTLDSYTAGVKTDSNSYTYSDADEDQTEISFTSFNIGSAFRLNGTVKTEKSNFGLRKIEVTQTDTTNTGYTHTYTVSRDTNSDGTFKDTFTSTDSGFSYNTSTGKWYIKDLPRKSSDKTAIDVDTTATYTYTFKVYDLDNNLIASKSVKAVTDHTAPYNLTVELDNRFGINSINGSSYKFSGSVDEEGLGLKAIMYAIDSSESVDSSTVWDTYTCSPDNGTVNWTLPDINLFASGKGSYVKETRTLHEGIHYIHIKVIDLANNVSEVLDKGFCMDQNAPSIDSVLLYVQDSEGNYPDQGTDITAASSEIVVKTPFKFTTTASDQNGIESLTAQNTKPATPDSIAMTKDSSSNLWTSDAIETEGTYILSITAVDGSGNGLTGASAISGKTTTVQKTILYDKTEPVIDEVKINNVKILSTADNSSKWYSSKTVEISVKASDSASGISGVKVAVENPDDDSNWTSLTLGSDGYYSGNAILKNEGSNTLYIKAIDVAKNEKNFQTQQSGGAADGIIVKVDISTPSLETLWYQTGEAITEAGGTIYVSGITKKDITVYGSCYDLQSGMAALSFTLDGNTFTAKTDELYYSTTEPTVDAAGGNTKAWITTAESAADVASGKFSNNLSDFTDKTKIRTWKAVFDKENVASGKFKVIAENGAGGTSELSAFTISVDSKIPSIQNISISSTSEKYKVYTKEADSIYYVNNSEENTRFAISGIATDNIAVSKVQISIGTYYTNSVDTSSEWSFSNINLKSVSGTNVLADITAYDKAGNSKTSQITINFDNTPPAAKHWADKNNKDIYFRIGEAANDRKSTDTSSSDYSKNVVGDVWSTTLDEDVGSKYSSETYGNSSTIKIRGYFDEASSGLNMVYYSIMSEKPTETVISNLKNKYKDITTKISPLATEAEKRVIYTDSEGTKQSQTVKSNFAATISGFDNLNNYLVLIAVDNVGNVEADSLSGYSVTKSTTAEDSTNKWNGTDSSGNGIPYYSINQETVVPEIYLDSSFTETIYTNLTETATNYITLYGNAVDEHAGVESIVFTINGNTISKDLTTYGSMELVQSGTVGEGTTTYSYNNSYWKLIIKPSVFGNLTSGNVSVYAKVTDKAGEGNSKTVSVATVTLDTVAPTVTISSPTDKDKSTTGIQVNGTISLSGKITNEQYLKEDSGSGSMVLYYTTSASLAASAPADNAVLTGTGSASSAWIKLATTLHSTGWTFEGINTKALPDSYDGTNYSTSYIADGSTVYFTVAASDKAGNIGYASPLTVIFDQDTDRPEITFSNITLVGKNTSNEEGAMSDEYDVWVKTDTLYGTVSDDDGVTALYVIESESEPAETDWTSATNVYSNGAWEYTVSEDGYKVLWFKVVDSDGGSFISSASFTDSSAYGSLADTQKTALLRTPKLIDKDTTVNRYGYKTGSGKTASTNVLNSVVYVQIDTNDPEIYQDVWYTFSSDVKDTLLNADSTNKAAILNNPAGYSWNSINDISGSYIGGPGRLMFVLYKTRDANGISATTESFGTVSGTKVYPETQSTPYSLTNAYYSQVVEFDISSIESSNSVSMTLNVTDRANRTYSGKYYFAIDNEAPIIEFRNRSDGDSVYGSVSVSVTGRTTENRIGVIDTLKFCITDSATAPTASNENWVDFTEYVNTASWSLTFDGADNTTSSESTTFHTKTLNAWMDTICGSGTSSSNESKTLYLWVYAVDSLGNTGISNPESLQLEVITQGDKPAVSIAYPASDATVGNTIRLSGSSDISTDSVAAIWLQIDPSYDATAGFNTSGWASELTSLITDSEGNLKSVGYTIVTESETSVSPSTTTPGSTLGSGILAGGTVQSWNLPINTLNELDSQLEDGTDEEGNKKYKNRVVAVRAYAISKTNAKISNYAEVYFTVDPNSPSFSGYNGVENYLLTKVENGVVTKTMKYTSGMWISGEWLLTGSITHSAGILTLTKDTTSLVSEGEALTSFSDGTEITSFTNSKGATGWNFKIPVGSSTADAVGKTSFTLKAVDNSDNHNTASLNVNINYDNKAPSSFTVSGLSSTKVNTFKQSNSTFSLSGSVVEGGTESGFARNAFYFTRDLTVTSNNVSTTTRYFIDPMIAKDDSTTSSYTTLGNKKANFVALGTVSGTTFTAADGIFYDLTDGLYWKTSTGASIANTNQLTVTAVPDNVRAGGICKINNVVYRIKSISDKTITVEGEFESESNLTVYFALAQIIDNTVTESGTTNIYENAYLSLTNDDGDWMVEGITQNGTTYSWTASINSKNIYDGSVTLHFSYFDAAGNVASSSYSGMVSNNAPRLAGVTIATDYDGDGAFTSSGETKSYWVGNTTVTTSTNVAKQVAEEITVASANNTAYYTLKDKTEIRAEVIGGNGKLYYSYNIGTTLGADGNIKGNNTTALTLTGTNYKEYDTTADDSYMLTSDSYINSRTATIEIPLAYFDNYLGTGTGEGENNTHYIANSEVSAPTWFQYKIWDETDGKTVFTDSQHATMNIALAVKVHDTEDPVTTITPFYWNSSSDNSLYQNSTSNGHIELPDDLPPETFTASGTGVYGLNPKVSGKVVISGYASDNIRLGSLNITIPKSSVLTEATTVAVYYNGVWYDSSSDADSIPSGVTLTQGTMDSNGWSFTVSSTADGAYNDEKGHRVKWTLNYNSEKITNKAAAGVTVTVQSVDKVSKTGDGSYTMDVVPYITGVTTSLSTLKSNNPSVYNRTALGHYAVKSDETVTLTGFNLDETSVSISSLSTSGYYNYSVNSIPALNNLNKNDSKGSYSGTVDLTANPTGVYSTYANYYNRQPNNDNNNLLTDDIYFDVWEFNDVGISQTSGYITEPIMKVNPKNGMLSFGFNSGPANYCMANGQSTSYTTWVGNYARFSTCGFTVDENGNTHGITVGLDTNPNSGSAGRMEYITSLWGTSEKNSNGNYHGYNASRFETIGAPGGTYNGSPYTSWVILEDRFASPSLATAVHGSDTYVILAYYDDLNGAVRFRYGNLSNKNREKNKRGISFDGFVDQNQYKIPNADGTLTSSNFGDTDNANHLAFDTNNNTAAFSTIASKSMTAKAGNFVSIDIIKGESADKDVIVATWYDASADKWWYSYKVNPYNDNDMAAGTGDGYWSTPIALKSKAGESCQIAVDTKGGVHIASYDNANANLVYAYLSSYDDTTPQVVTVDSYAFTGTNLRLDTAVSDDGNYVIPYIGYYMSSTQKTKMACLKDVVSASDTKATRETVTIPAGVDSNDAVTSKWESTIIPSESRYADNYNYSYVNIGLWKDSDGKAKNMTGTSSTYTDNSGIGAENTNTVYGNGTKNPVLAYATRVGTRGHLETAQMR